MLKAFGSGVLAAALGSAVLMATLWTTAPTPLAARTNVHVQKAEIGLVENPSWIAHLAVTEAQLKAAEADWGLWIGS
jgi:tellurite resistance protein TehA-like permease